MTERISASTDLLFKMNEPKNTSKEDRRGIFFSMPVTLSQLENLAKLLEAGDSFTNLRTGTFNVRVHRNPETARSIDGVRVLGSAGDATDTLEAFIRVDGQRGRLNVKVDDQNLRSDTFTLADLRIAVGRHQEILRVRERNTRRSRVPGKGPAPIPLAAEAVAEHA